MERPIPSMVAGCEGAEIRFPVGITLEEAKREIIRRTIEAYPSIKDAAQVLGIGLRTLHSKIRMYGLHRPR